MRATSIVKSFLHIVTPSMHGHRRESLRTVLTSLLSGSDLSVTSLGRNIQSHTTEKHQIKRSMRLCSNSNLYRESSSIYCEVAQRLIGEQKHPLILVDWSDLDPRKQHFLLRASVAIDGRSLTLFEKVYTLEEKDKPATHKAFMETLKSMLPDDCKPIVVSDAGFRAPWFLLIISLGWDYVGRVRNKTLCRLSETDEWQLTSQLYEQATNRPKGLGRFTMRRKNSFQSNMVVYRKRKQGRQNLTATGNRTRRNKTAISCAKRENEPWLLATSLPIYSLTKTRRIMNIYKTRMQIEESFRDLKTGLNFNACQTRTKSNLVIIIMLGMLAQYILFMFGVMAKKADRHRRYQANSLKTNVLSYQFIGLRLYKDRKYRFIKKHWIDAHRHLNDLIATSVSTKLG